MIVYLPKLGCTQGRSISVPVFGGLKGVGWVNVTLNPSWSGGTLFCDICECKISCWEDVTVGKWDTDDCEEWVAIGCILVHCRWTQHFLSLPKPPYFFMSRQKRHMPHSGLLQPAHWPHLFFLLVGILWFAGLDFLHDCSWSISDPNEVRRGAASSCVAFGCVS